ncbi:MAG: glucose-6-phosphate dehydrogenase [Actinomycetota bacterium]|nr:glucose-6-phosphate dehydrogenase [Actinomycetota bacterium]
MTEPVTFIIFGATGHLSRTKLIPALAHVLEDRDMGSHAVIGIGSKPRAHDDFRSFVEESLATSAVDAAARTRFLNGAFAYHAVTSDDSYRVLAESVARVESEKGLPGNRILYLAVPPSQLDTTVRGISATGLDTGGGWTRIVVEKPFGKDLATAVASNAAIHETFSENQVYRIDHYLGKETVRNLLVFRFTNSLFEQTWNRRHIESVEITVAESAGLDGRAAYFDESGAVRDMVQNHLTQILTLIAMEPPVTMDARSIHIEKVKVLASVRPIEENDAVLGRYTAGTIDGEQVSGYLDEPDVPNDSITPTFAALRINVDNWRWHGVPFYLRTGKRMSQRATEVTVRYLRPPICLFHEDGACQGHQNTLTLRLQPDEGFELLFDVKQPGPGTAIRQIPLAVSYGEVLETAHDAYETLLAEVIDGDQTLFVSSEEVESAWGLYDSLLDRSDVNAYAAGTDGPESAQRVITTYPGDWAAI